MSGLASPPSTDRDAAAAAGWASAPAVRTLALVIASTLILLLPALVNGRPFLFPDSEQYFAVGKTIVEKVLPPPAQTGAAQAPDAESRTAADVTAATASRATVADLSGSATPVGLAITTPAGPDAAADAPGDGGLAAIAGGRSAAYSAAVYLAARLVNVGLVAVVQALIAAWLVVRSLEMFWGEPRPRATLGVVAALALLSPLGFHVGFIMPDVFAGLMTLAALLLAFGRTQSRLETAGLVAVIAFAAVSHATIMLLAVVVAGLLLAFKRTPLGRDQVRMRAVGWCLAAAVAAAAFSSAYGWAARRVAGETIASPPYLMARVIADGPGGRLLTDACTDERTPYAACAFAGETYFDHNDFLWNTAADHLTFADADPALRDALAAEERRFVIDAALRYPAHQIAASLHNALALFARGGLQEVDGGAERLITLGDWSASEILARTPGVARCVERPGACPIDKPIANAWSAVMTAADAVWLVALVAVTLAWTRARLLGRDIGGDPRDSDALLLSLATLVALLVVNAGICGALSGPQDRYQTRLLWLAPLLLAAGWPIIARLGRNAAQGMARG